MAKKLYVSNSTESSRMFKNGFLESLTKVHYTVPLIFWIPVIGYLVYKAYAVGGMPGTTVLLYAMLGLVIWTLTEYVMHRWLFHYHPTTEWGKRINFIFHGVHHDYPKDRLRLVDCGWAASVLALYCLSR